MIEAIDGTPQHEWVGLRGRRLLSLGGTPRPPPEAMLPEPLPVWVQSVCEALVRAGVFPADAPPNHVLLNQYEPGQGIQPHKDGPLYAPLVAILSLGSSASFDFVRDDTERAPLASLLLPRRGLLVFSDDAYHKHLHSVPACLTDGDRPNLIRCDRSGLGSSAGDVDGASSPPPPPPRSRRLSLTVRRVLRVLGEELAERERHRRSEQPWERRAALARWLDERDESKDESEAERAERVTERQSASTAAKVAAGASPDSVLVDAPSITHTVASGWEHRSSS